jgi:anti-sigma B factor antagonist
VIAAPVGVRSGAGLEPDNLEVNEQALGDGQLIDARGEIDHVSTTLVADALRRATVAGEGPVVLDLSETTFIDSAGISTLLNGLRRLTRLRRKLIVVCPPGPARRVFETLGLVGTFEIVDSLGEAAI